MPGGRFASQHTFSQTLARLIWAYTDMVFFLKKWIYIITETSNVKAYSMFDFLNARNHTSNLIYWINSKTRIPQRMRIELDNP